MDGVDFDADDCAAGGWQECDFEGRRGGLGRGSG